MQDNLEEDDTIAADMAAAMGFSSFGGNKKRKFDATNSPKSQPAGKGANSIPLGVRIKTSEHEGYDSVLQSTEASHTKGKQKQPPASGLADFLARGQVLEQEKLATAQQGVPMRHFREKVSSTSVSFGGPAIPQAELHALRGGVSNEDGDMVYFLPSFLENPWEKLEQRRG